MRIICRPVLAFTLFWVFSQTAWGNDPLITLKGNIKNLEGNNVAYARVAIKFVSADFVLSENKPAKEPAVPVKSSLITYSNKKGNWEFEFTRLGKVLIRIYANAYRPAFKIIDLKEWSARKEKVEFFLKEGLNDIEWMSLAYHQLYVKPVHQKSIEQLIAAGNIAESDNYLNKKIKKKNQAFAYSFAGYLSFLYNKPDLAKKYFSLGGSKLWYNLMGTFKLKQGKLRQSFTFFKQGITSRQRADGLFRLAEKFEQARDLEQAKVCYEASQKEYDRLITSFLFKWDDEFINRRFTCHEKLNYLINTKNRNKEEQELRGLLAKAGTYCKKLKKVDIYYYVNEEKRDKVYLLNDLHWALENPSRFFADYSTMKLKGKKITDVYKYDVQLVVKESGVTEENRKLISQVLDSSSFEIPVLSYTVQKPLYGPNTLVGLAWQNLFSYKIVGREKIFNKDCVIIEASPNWNSYMNRMSGQIWVNQEDGSVLKIEWHHYIMYRDQLKNRGLVLRSEPKLRFILEYGIEKYGLRFPSRYIMEESYLQDPNPPFKRLEIETRYTNYQFFVVEIEDVKVEVDE